MWNRRLPCGVLAGGLLGVALWVAAPCAAYDFDKLQQGGQQDKSSSRGKTSVGGVTGEARSSHGGNVDAANRKYKEWNTPKPVDDRVNCERYLTECLEDCDKYMRKDNGGILTPSDKDRCGYQCFDARDSCRSGKYAMMKRNRCYAMCEMMIDDNGGLLTMSSKEKCRFDCERKHQ